MYLSLALCICACLFCFQWTLSVSRSFCFGFFLCCSPFLVSAFSHLFFFHLLFFYLTVFFVFCFWTSLPIFYLHVFSFFLFSFYPIFFPCSLISSPHFVSLRHFLYFLSFSVFVLILYFFHSTCCSLSFWFVPLSLLLSVSFLFNCSKWLLYSPFCCFLFSCLLLLPFSFLSLSLSLSLSLLCALVHSPFFSFFRLSILSLGSTLPVIFFVPVSSFIFYVSLSLTKF